MRRLRPVDRLVPGSPLLRNAQQPYCCVGEQEREYGMADERGSVVRVLPRIADIEAAAWDRLANPPERPYDPFVSHAFLKALEDAGTVTRRTGWIPQHIVLEEDGEPVGAMPCYVKTHSQGEY